MSIYFQRLPFALIVAIMLLSGAASAQTIVPRGSGLKTATAVTLDPAGDIFTTDIGDGSIKRIAAADGYAATSTLGRTFGIAGPVAVDQQGDVFAADMQYGTIVEFTAADGYASRKIVASWLPTDGSIPLPLGGFTVARNGDVFFTYSHTVKEVTAASGYSTIVTINAQFRADGAVAVDQDENVFFTDYDRIIELPVAGGYATAETIATGFSGLLSIAVDDRDDIFVADQTGESAAAVYELPVATGYPTLHRLATGLAMPVAVALDGAGDLFVTDFGSGGIVEFAATAGYGTGVPVASSLNGPDTLALDGAGNIFVECGGDNSIQEIPAADSHTSSIPFVAGIGTPSAVAIDAAENVFVLDFSTGRIQEFLAAGNYTIFKTLPGGGSWQSNGMALDAAANLFVISPADSSIHELAAATGYSSARAIAAPSNTGSSIAVDQSGNVFLANIASWTVSEFLASSEYSTSTAINLPEDMRCIEGLAVDATDNLFASCQDSSGSGGTVMEFLAADRYETGTTVIDGVDVSSSLGLDRYGDVFILSSARDAIDEIIPATTGLAAAVLPGSRAVAGGTATVFATLINPGAAALDDCRISLDAMALLGLTLHYQTTDPATNTPTGSADTPVTIAGNGGSQSFLLSFQGSPANATISAGLPLDFTCGSGSSAIVAPVLPGIDTIDLFMNGGPVANIVALSATPTADGVLAVPNGGAAAFAVASDNIGDTQTLTVSVDSAGAVLPMVEAICQTDPATGQCLAPPAASFSMSYQAGTAPTFSIFVAANGAIPFAPAASRIFVRFTDQFGNDLASTSVAVKTQ